MIKEEKNFGQKPQIYILGAKPTKLTGGIKYSMMRHVSEPLVLV